MNISIQVPDDFAARLTSHWQDLARHTLETLVADAYRRGIITHYQVQGMMGFESRWETDAFLKQSGAFLDYSEDDLAKDLATLRRVART